ncbi:MAG: CotH kinase family protein [Verrucomicrobia bacterium]|nr:CotH kinase family protein [Verrucomicrobiota bacterium]
MTGFRPPTSIRLAIRTLAILAGAMGLQAEPVITEFLTANTTSLTDEDGAHSDWIELFNPDNAPFDLNGWYLTDSISNKTKWQFPAVSLPAGGYLIVFASDKNRRDPTKRLHTNFGLDDDGEYLALVRPDGSVTSSEFAPKYPRQQDNVSYGFPGSATSGARVFLLKPTPGAANSAASPVGLTETVTFSRPAGPFSSTFSLTLSGAGASQQIRYTTTPASRGATAPEPTASSPAYAAPFSITGATVVRAAVFSGDGSTRGPVRTVYYSKAGASLAAATSTLPVLVLDSLGSGPLTKDNLDHTSWVAVYPARSGGAPLFSVAPELASPISLTVRGSSSAEFPKKGYNFRFEDEFGHAGAPEFLDLTEHEKWALVAPWKYDLSYLNNPIVYEFSRRLGRWAPRTRLVEGYFNTDGGDVEANDYAGIYLVTDRIEVDRERVDLANLTPTELTAPDVTGGYILKIDTKDADEIGWTTSRGVPGGGAAIVLVSPSAAEVAPAQLSYLRDYVQRMENALVASRDSGWAQRTYLDYLDRAAWVDHHLLNTFVANPDALVRSAYFTKNKNGRIAAGPVWDFDRALGSYWDERSYRHDVWVGVGAADVWRTGWWGILVQDPEFLQDWIDRWQGLRRTELATAKLGLLVDNLSAGLTTAAARDAGRWPDNASPYGSYAAQVARLKTWLAQRAEWIDQQFLAAPTVTSSGSNLIFTPAPGAQLAYTLDGSDPRSLGGDIAPNATVSASAVTVPAGSNIHLRSYAAGRQSRTLVDGSFAPDTPWSSAVGGPSSSPLAPAARLVNLSTRAQVAAGDNSLIAGVVVADTEAKRYLARGIGPALGAFGATGFVPDPQLTVFSGTGRELARNNDWEQGTDAAKLPSHFRAVGAFSLPAASRDAALTSEFTAGSYTLQVSTATSQAGIGLVELYELDGNGRTLNLSTRAQVRSGDGVLIGGFVVSGPAYKRVLIRAIGPTLTGFGVSGTLRDPVLTLYSGQTVVATNDRWEAVTNLSALSAASRRVGAFALAANSEDAALFITVPPGAYTVEVKGKDAAEGVALLEVYEVP